MNWLCGLVYKKGLFLNYLSCLWQTALCSGRVWNVIIPSSMCCFEIIRIDKKHSFFALLLPRWNIHYPFLLKYRRQGHIGSFKNFTYVTFYYDCSPYLYKITKIPQHLNCHSFPYILIDNAISILWQNLWRKLFFLALKY